MHRTHNRNLNLLLILSGLWHGVSAGILKTVPKYVTAIVVKDFMEEHLPHGDSKDKVRSLHTLITDQVYLLPRQTSTLRGVDSFSHPLADLSILLEQSILSTSLIIPILILITEHPAVSVCSEVSSSRNSRSRVDKPSRRHQKRVSLRKFD